MVDFCRLGDINHIHLLAYSKQLMQVQRKEQKHESFENIYQENVT